jgi:hypothetical protein
VRFLSSPDPKSLLRDVVVPQRSEKPAARLHCANRNRSHELPALSTANPAHCECVVVIQVVVFRFL